MRVVFVYMTAGSTEEARTIGSALVSSGLAACVNMIDTMKSIYRWEGKIQEDDEVVLIAKNHRRAADEADGKGPFAAQLRLSVRGGAAGRGWRSRIPGLDCGAGGAAARIRMKEPVDSFADPLAEEDRRTGR